MAAITTANQYGSIGNIRFSANASTTLTDAYTWDSGLTKILFWGVTTSTATAGQYVGGTVSNGTITLALEGGTPTGIVWAAGF
jgi:hypothetical protein